MDPNRAVSQYVRDSWGSQQGLPPGPIYAIAQTPDGYLWLGTERGLVRFDGVTFTTLSARHSRRSARPDGAGSRER